MSAQYDLTLNRNETFSLYLDYLDENDVPINLSGMTGKMLIKRYKNAPEGSVLIFSSPYGISCGVTGAGPSGGIKLNRNSGDTGGQTGGILIKMNPFVTMTLAVGKSFYDIFLLNGTTSSTRLLEGAIDITQEVTRNDIEIVRDDTGGGAFD